ncbi:aminoacyl-tRNA hydrolase [Sutcliffiella sp. NC1]|uniref:Peptidyl-tRNA hydrolase n=2 Tax=Bacillaceae TaxID=186817 RepID=A0A223KX47_9BACI|nr:aminoacyl-tRNA hydrolase [Sutcliffiella sp. NC1]AST93983.1 aminoacyl-tRNA hydrolase [Sutcliffiella cohnii]MED4018413.1 aminoacyl-tRNA hydrolase [Sutcliffiella cohnii]WBL15186.1 aminoacyl-tRNA hydrolase [Sutcliffiella sp. NC1]
MIQLLRSIFSKQEVEVGEEGMKVIVGLGNPGPKYAETRHNIGFMVIDELANRWNISLTQSKFKGQFGQGLINGEKVILVKPLTYMNLSGECIRPLLDYYKVEIEDIYVIYDDLDLPVGKLRLRQKGSAGGHNGIKSLIQHLQTQQFNRVRMGIDRPTNGQPISDYVLGKFTVEERPIVQESVEQAAKACEESMKTPFLQVMNTFNQ